MAGSDKYAGPRVPWKAPQGPCGEVQGRKETDLARGGESKGGQKVRRYVDPVWGICVFFVFVCDLQPCP